MLSRPSSLHHDANELRRARSTPCVQRRTSSSSLINPVAAKQHAIVAATLAYERAYCRAGTEVQQDEHNGKPRRERSNRVGRSEGQGSHFEAGQLARHRSNKKPSTSARPSNDHPRPRWATVNSFAPKPELISHSHSVGVKEYTNTTAKESSKENGPALNFHLVSKSRSIDAHPGRGLVTSIDAISFDVSTPRSALHPAMQCADDTTTHDLGRDVTDSFPIPEVPPIPLTHNTIYKVDERVAKARDHHLQQFHMHKIRHRASLMLTPFKNLRIGSGETAPLSGILDNGVTYGNRQSTPELKEIRPIQQRVASDAKQSTSLKDKIRRVFRKQSAVHIGLPVQQVEASRAHFGDFLSVSSSKMSTIRAKAPHFMKNTVPVTPPSAAFVRNMRVTSREQARPISSAASDATVITSSSRVTSWADSTLAGTTTSQGSNILTIIHEDQQSPETISVDSFKQSSLSGVRHNNTRCVAGDNWPSPELEIHKLVHTNSSPNDYETNFPSLSRKSSVVYDKLPSQVHRLSRSSSRAGDFIRATVRVVSSSSNSTESFRSRKQRSSSTHSNISPLLLEAQNQTSEQTSLPLANEWRERRKRNRFRKLQKPGAVVTPSAEQIASLVERSNGRWKNSPDQGSMSLFYPHSPRYVCTSPITENEGYTQSVASPTVSSAEEVFMTVREPPSCRSTAVISPSLYSRNTNSISPTKGRPNDSAVSLDTNSSNDTGTAVIITSHPVDKYPIGCHKKPDANLAKTSRDWRDWVSNQVHDLDSPQPEDLTLNNDYVYKPTDSGHRREYAQIIEGEDIAISSIAVDTESHCRSAFQIRPSELQTIYLQLADLHPTEMKLNEPQLTEPRTCSSSFGPNDRPPSRLPDRPRLKSRSVSCMNERFPLINTGRPPSRSSRKPTLPVENTRSKITENTEKIGKDEENVSPVSTPTVPSTKCPGGTLLRRPQSTHSFQRSKSSLAQYTTSDNDNHNQAKPTSRATSHIPRPTANITPLNRPKSALDIRAARHNRITPTPARNIDTDPTLAAIFKGPYRDSTASPKPLLNGKFTSSSKENSPFPKEQSPSVRTIHEDDSSSFISPPTPTSGQKLAEQFLIARRLRHDNRPSVSSSSVGSPVFM
jgi:hypothetical protein